MLHLGQAAAQWDPLICACIARFSKQDLSHFMQEQDSAKAMKNQPYRLLERSIFCDRMVFVESLKDSNIMSEMELSIYDSW